MRGPMLTANVQVQSTAQKLVESGSARILVHEISWSCDADIAGAFQQIESVGAAVILTTLQAVKTGAVVLRPKKPIPLPFNTDLQANPAGSASWTGAIGLVTVVYQLEDTG